MRISTQPWVKQELEILINIKICKPAWYARPPESPRQEESLKHSSTVKKVHSWVLFIVLNWEPMKKPESRPGELRESSAKLHTCKAPLRLRTEQKNWENCSVLWPLHYVQDSSCLLLKKKGDQRVSSEVYARKLLSWYGDKTKWNPSASPPTLHTHTLSLAPNTRQQQCDAKGSKEHREFHYFETQVPRFP